MYALQFKNNKDVLISGQIYIKADCSEEDIKLLLRETFNNLELGVLGIMAKVELLHEDNVFGNFQLNTKNPNILSTARRIKMAIDGNSSENPQVTSCNAMKLFSNTNPTNALGSIELEFTEFNMLPTLQQIFDENSIEQGGTLYCEECRPSPENYHNLLTVRLNNIPIGYILLDAENKLHNDIKESTPLTDIGTATKFYYIKQCAIAKTYQSNGWGKQMYLRLFELFPTHNFLSHVSVKNLTSLKLHYRADFRKVGVYCNSNFHNSGQDYISDLVLHYASKEE